MRQKVFCVYDCKAEAFLPPFLCPTAGVALRRFEVTATDVDHDFSRFAADYTLFEIGEFDEVGGFVQMHEAKMNLGTALQFKQLPVTGGE